MKDKHIKLIGVAAIAWLIYRMRGGKPFIVPTAVIETKKD